MVRCALTSIPTNSRMRSKRTGGKIILRPASEGRRYAFHGIWYGHVRRRNCGVVLVGGGSPLRDWQVAVDRSPNGCF
jgi:hypothetical protein